MSIVNKQALTAELRRFNQRKLAHGELVILAFTVANQLPIFDKGTQNPKLDMVKNHQLMENVVYRLCEFASTDRETLDHLKDLTFRFLMWRSTVAWGDMSVMFSGEHNTVIDDLSGLLRFHETGCLCSVGDVALSANWLKNVFTDLVKSEIQHLSLSQKAVNDVSE